jgi:geranylgeranyl diphosphate synthase, type II
MSIPELSARIEQELQSWPLPHHPAGLYEPVAYTLALGGKRMRPLLTLLGCKIFSENVEQAMGPALAVEVFHNFTLLHDDIMDNAPIRRGKPSVHVKWNANTAILSGDAMMILAYQALATADGAQLPKLLPLFNETALQICEGQQLDMEFEHRSDVTIAEYEEMIRLKTAVLLATSLKLGAIVGGADDIMAQHLYDFGLNAGIAFQLQDDILDVFGDSGKVGKLKGGDIIADKKTYLMLKALELAGQSERDEIAHWTGATDLPADKVLAIVNIYNRLGIREQAEQRMWHFHRLAMSHLEKVQGCSHWLAVLHQFVNDLMHREH